MSTEIENRVVKMQFDNSNFEKNVSTTLSSLDKLKRALKFDNATDGLTSFKDSISRVNFNSLTGSIGTVEKKLSELGILGVTAMVKISNAAIDAGKNIVNSLTIEPIKQGFKEYELKMGSVQTIMASTKEDIGTVNKYLEELNLYADRTIYSFSDMTSSIGKFTNAGVKLEDAVAAIKGISNEAALSGANANEASRAMYNFAQALAAGYVKLIDWKSIETANMATKEFKEELIKTAAALGTIKKVGNEYVTVTTDAKGAVSDAFTATKNFNDSLSHQWLTTDVLIQTLSRYSDETSDLGKRAFSAAQDIKTFSMMMDTLKEAAGSGWAQTFQILFGDLEQATVLWSTLGNSISGIIDLTSEFRNTWIAGAFDSKWSLLTEKIEKAGGSVKDFEKVLKDVAKEHNVELDKIIKKEGSLEKALLNGKISVDLISEAMNKYTGVTREFGIVTKKTAEENKEYKKTVEELLETKWSDGTKLVEGLTKATKDQTEVEKIAALVWKKANKSLSDTEITAKDLAYTLGNLSDKELKSLGITRDRAEALKEIALQATLSGRPLKNLLKTLDKPSGRELVIDTIKNTMTAINQILKAVGKAFRKVFKEADSSGIYNLLEAFNKLSEKLILSDKASENLTKTFSGLFSILDLIYILIDSVVKIIFTFIDVFTGASKKVGEGALGITGSVGEAITAFHDWLVKGDKLERFFARFRGVLSDIKDKIQEVVEKVKSIPAVQNAIDSIKDSLAKIKEIILDIKDNKKLAFGDGQDLSPFLEMLTKIKDKIKEIASFIFGGLKEGFEKYAPIVLKTVSNIFTSIITKIKEIFDIKSPSKVMIAIGAFIMAGLIGGISSGKIELDGVLKDICDKIKDAFSNIEWEKIFAAGFSIASIAITREFATALKNLSAPFEGAGKVLDSTSSMFSSIAVGIANLSNAWAKTMKAARFKTNMDGIKSLAIGIGILAASIYALSKIESKDLVKALLALKAITTIFNGVIFVYGLVEKFLLSSKVVTTKSIIDNIAKSIAISSMMISLSVMMIAMAGALKIMSSIENPGRAIGVFTVIMAELAILLGAIEFFSYGSAYKAVLAASAFVLALGIFANNMGKLIKMFGQMEPKNLIIGIGVVTYLMALAAALILLTTKIKTKQLEGSAGIIKAVALCFVAMGLLVKILGKIDPETLGIGLFALTYLEALIIILIRSCSSENEKKMINASGTLLGVAVCMGIMALITKELGKLDLSNLAKGLAAVTVLSIIAGVLIGITSMVKDTNKAVFTLLGVAVMLGVLTAATVILSQLNLKNLAKGLAAVSVLVGLVDSILACASKAKEAKGTMIAIDVMLGLLLAITVVLAYIPIENLGKGLAAMAIIVGLLDSILVCSKYVSGSMKTVIALTVLLALTAGVLIALAELKSDNLDKSASALALVLTSLAIAFKMVNGETKDVDIKGLSISIGAMAGLVGVALIAITALANAPIEAEGLIIKATAMSEVLLAMSVAFAIMSKFGDGKDIDIKQALVNVSLMGGFMLAIATAFLVMNDIKTDGLLIKATSISIVLEAMAAAMVIMSYSNEDANNKAIAAIAGVIIFVAEVAGVFWLIDELNPDGMIAKATSLSIVLLAISAAVVIISYAQAASVVAVAAAIAMGLVLIEISAALVILNKVNPEGLIEKALGLSIVLVALTGVILILGGFTAATGGIAIPALVAGAVAGAIAIGEFVSILLKMFIAIATVVGWVLKNDAVRSGIDTFLSFIQDVALAIGKAVGNLIGGAIDSIGDSLERFGMCLTKFTIAAQPFFFTMQTMTKSVFENGKNMLDMLLAFAAAQILIKLSKIFGETDMASISKGLVSFGMGVTGFYMATLQITDPERLSLLSKAGKSLGDMIKNLPSSGGWLQTILGEKDMDKFATSLPKLGTAIAEFAKTMKPVNKEELEKSTTAAKALAELNNSLPASGGVLQTFIGEKDMSNFGKQLGYLGSGIAEFSEKTKNVDKGAVERSASSAKAIAELEKSLPASGGKFQDWFGGKNLNVFSEGLKSLGAGINYLYSSTKDVTIDDNLIGKLETFIKQPIKIISELDVSKSEFKKFDSISTYLESFVNGIRCFETIDPIKVKDGITSISDLNSINFATFFDQFKNIRESIDAKTYESLNYAVSSLERLCSLVATVNSTDFNTLNNISNTLDKIGKNGIKNICDAFNDKNAREKYKKSVIGFLKQGLDAIEDYKQKYWDAGDSILSNFKFGMITQEALIIEKIHELMTQIMFAINLYLKPNGSEVEGYPTFWQKGNEAGNAFANGMDSTLTRVRESASKMGSEALNALKEATDQNSPSKKFYEAGDYCVIGFVNAFTKNLSKSYKAGYNIASSSMSGAYDGVSDFSKSNSVYLTPTVSPVVDFRDANNKSLSLSTSMNMAVSEPINTMSSNLARTEASINASNEKVIESVNGLRDDMAKYYDNGDTEVALYVDSKKMASSIAKPMNRELNILSRRGAF